MHVARSVRFAIYDRYITSHSVRIPDRSLTIVNSRTSLLMTIGDLFDSFTVVVALVLGKHFVVVTNREVHS